MRIMAGLKGFAQIYWCFLIFFSFFCFSDYSDYLNCQQFNRICLRCNLLKDYSDSNIVRLNIIIHKIIK